MWSLRGTRRGEVAASVVADFGFPGEKYEKNCVHFWIDVCVLNLGGVGERVGVWCSGVSEEEGM